MEPGQRTLLPVIRGKEERERAQYVGQYQFHCRQIEDPNEKMDEREQRNIVIRTPCLRDIEFLPNGRIDQRMVVL